MPPEGEVERGSAAASTVSLDDPTLVRSTAAGDRDAFEELVRRHHPAVRRFLRGALSRPEDAEDATQETFLAAFRAAAAFRGDASVRTWLLTIARHIAYHARRKDAQRPEQAVDPNDLALLAGWGASTPELAAIRHESRDALTHALRRLAPEEREVLIMRDLENLDGPHVAAALGVSLAAMKSRLHRARLHLGAALRQGGLDAAR